MFPYFGTPQHYLHDALYPAPMREGTPYYKKNLHSARVNKSSNSQKSKKERKNL